jgi:hypothetical protein
MASPINPGGKKDIQVRKSGGEVGEQMHNAGFTIQDAGMRWKSEAATTKTTKQKNGTTKHAKRNIGPRAGYTIN